MKIVDKRVNDGLVKLYNAMEILNGKYKEDLKKLSKKDVLDIASTKGNYELIADLTDAVINSLRNSEVIKLLDDIDTNIYIKPKRVKSDESKPKQKTTRIVVKSIHEAIKEYDTYIKALSVLEDEKKYKKAEVDKFKDSGIMNIIKEDTLVWLKDTGIYKIDPDKLVLLRDSGLYKFLNTIPIIVRKGIYEGANYEFDKFTFSHLVSRAEHFDNKKYKKVIHSLYSKAHKALIENRDKAPTEDITKKIMAELSNVDDFFTDFINTTKNVQVVCYDD